MLRLLAILFGGAGIAAGALDFGRDEAFRFADVGELWFMLHRDSLQLLQPAIERHLAPFLWDPVMLTILTLPAAPLFVGLAAALGVVDRFTD
jgi:hypothetical protein